MGSEGQINGTPLFQFGRITSVTDAQVHMKKTKEGGEKSRIKERTIQDVIQKVSLWRLLYTGFQHKGVFVKMSLEDAAKKVKISKKSLDDYLMQLRQAKKFGFDFESHAHQKVGVIRAFVREKKMHEMPKSRGRPREANPESAAENGPDTAAKTPRRRFRTRQGFKPKCGISAEELFLTNVPGKTDD